MAGNFEGVLASIPGLGGYLAAEQNNQTRQFGQLQQLATLQGIANTAAQAQQRQAALMRDQQMRGVLSQLGPEATPEQVARAVAPFASADDLLKTLTASQDRGAMRENQRALQSDRLLQQYELARQRAEDQTRSNAQRTQDRKDLMTLAASLKASGGGAAPKAPVGYRFTSDGESLEPIPGGPKDAAGGGKPLPTQAVKLQQGELDAIGTAASINADMSALEQQIESGKLKLGLVGNLASRGLNYVGLSTPESRNFASYNATLEKLRNDSLRLNKGVQTEGDAQRAWNELISNSNDADVVKQRLAEIKQINERAVALRKANVDALRKNYGAEAFDFSPYENQPAALNQGGQIETAAKAAFGGYEPNKYEYRIVNGKVQRRTK